MQLVVKFIVLLYVLSLVYCTTHDTSKEVTEKFLKYPGSGKLDRVEKLSTGPALTMIQMSKKLSGGYWSNFFKTSPDTIKIQKITCNVKDDEEHCTYIVLRPDGEKRRLR